MYKNSKCLPMIPPDILFINKYPWYNMPPILHKYLIHGPEIIESALVPIGQLTEEAQEARNKDFKRYREHYARKSRRIKTNIDIFNSFLVSSDPFIAGKRILPKKKVKLLPIEAKELLKSEINDDDDDDYDIENDRNAGNYNDSDD